MCGIAGMVSRQNSAPVDREVLQRMAETLRHRGPDDYGLEILGRVGCTFRRLSIIDLSSTGHQPMSDESKRYWITFNGEVFNYRELRTVLEDEGYRFRSASDAEVILKSYMHWGVNCFERFRGMWGIIIWDAVKNQVVASRDYFGIKPLYFLHTRDAIYWSSEIKAFQTINGKLEEDLGTSLDYLEYGLLNHSGRTFFKNVWELLPGQVAVIDADLQVSKHFCWTLEQDLANARPPCTEAEQISRFRDVLIDAVDLSLRSDVPVWVLLSGGLDSSAIVSIIHHIAPHEKINTITVVHDDAEINEFEYVQEVVRTKNCNVEIVRIDERQWLEELEPFIYHMEQPVASTSVVNHWFLMKELQHRGIKVILSGQGIDEVLYGYVKLYMGYLFADLLRAGSLAALGREVYYHFSRREHICSSSKEFYLQALKGLVPQWVAKYVKSRFVEGSHDFIVANGVAAGQRARYTPQTMESCDLLHNAFYRMLMVESIPRILHGEDKSSMAFSVEERVPFIDKCVISYLFSLPAHMKVRDGTSKWILRESLRGILPEKVRTRQSKLGFNSPEERWIQSKEFDEFVRTKRVLDALDGSVIDVKNFNERIQKFRDGERRYEPVFWRIYNYALWKSRFL